MDHSPHKVLKNRPDDEDDGAMFSIRTRLRSIVLFLYIVAQGSSVTAFEAAREEGTALPLFLKKEIRDHPLRNMTKIAHQGTIVLFSESPPDQPVVVAEAPVGDRGSR